MNERRRKTIAWVGTMVLPHEAEVRAWLRRGAMSASDIDDVLQEAYCRLSALEDVEHIANARAYLFQTTRNIVLEQVRRARIVRIETVAEIGSIDGIGDEPSPERIAGARRELARVMALIAALPDRCRRIVQLRKIEGVPQREIAQRLGVSENTVENESVRGLRLILIALAEGDAAAQRAAAKAVSHGKARERIRDQ